ncbi:MAG: YidC/Oxa1 family membrane protein insertase [Gemmatimonadota bacterium]|jgi:YidC/Oxa1 family membrane protein insertase
MEIWSGLVGLFRVALFGLAHVWGGSMGAAILTLSLVVRLALLPLTLRVARRARRYGEAQKALAPAMERLRRQWKDDPVRLNAEVLKLYRRKGIRPVRDSGLLGGFLQLPFVMALYSVIRQGAGAAGRFLWIGDLARPDRLLALGAAALAAAVATASPSTGGAATARLGALVSVAFTYVVLTRLAAGVGLYWAASNLVGVGQGLILRRGTRPR